MANYTPRGKQWFLDRIGKKIFRDQEYVCCPTCTDVMNNGIVVSDADHAEYLSNIDAEFFQGGTKLNYRDIK